MKSGLTLLAALLLVPALSMGGPNEDWRTTAASLGELTGVYVVVRYEAPKEAHYGLSESDLRSAVELRLKANNIRVLTEEEWEKTRRRPYLYLTVTGTKLTPNTEDPDYLFAWSLDLIQRVKVMDSPRTEGKAITWTQEYSAVLPKKDLRTIALKVSDLTLEFANALKSAQKGVAG